jgi:hypothetical protein
VPRFTAREIGRIETTYTSELGYFTWAWVVRADGEVLYRLSHVDGQAERNDWQHVCLLTAAERLGLTADRTRAAGLLEQIAREHGHYPVLTGRTAHRRR